MSTTRSRRIGKVLHRLHAHGARRVVREERGAGQLGNSVHHHSATSADSHAAGPAEGQRSVQLILDVIQRIENDPIFSQRDFVGLNSRLLIMRRMIPGNFERDPVRHTRSPSVDPLGRGPASDGHRRILHSRPSVRGAVHQRVRQKLFVVSSRIVRSLVRSARFCPLHGALRHRLRNFEHAR